MKNNNVTIHINGASVFKVILIALLFVALWVVWDVVLVVLTAVVIASAVSPATRWCVERHVPRTLAAIGIYAGLAILFVGAFYFLLLPLLNETATFLRNLPDYMTRIEAWNPSAEGGFLGSQQFVQDISNSLSLDAVREQVNAALNSFSQGFLSTASAIFGGLLSFVLIIVLSFYLSVQENGVKKFLQLITPDHYEGYILDLWKRAELKIGYWLQGQLILALIVAVLVYLGLLLLGVEQPLLLAVLAGLFELIPLFGPILAAIPAIIIASTQGGATLALLVAGLYIIIQQFENQLIYPLVVRKVVGVPPVIVIIALVVGAKLAGFLGIILSVPAAAIIIEILNDFSKKPRAQSEANG